MPKYADNHCNRIAGRVGKEYGMKSANKKKATRTKKLIKKADKRGPAPAPPRSKVLEKKAKARGKAPAAPGKKKRMTDEEFNAQFKSKPGDRNYAHEYSKGKDMSGMIGNIRGGPRRSKRTKKK